MHSSRRSFCSLPRVFPELLLDHKNDLQLTVQHNGSLHCAWLAGGWQLNTIHPSEPEAGPGGPGGPPNVGASTTIMGCTEYVMPVQRCSSLSLQDMCTRNMDPKYEDPHDKQP